MKINTITIGCSLILAAGCAHHDKYVKNEYQTTPVYGGNTTYKSTYDTTTTTTSDNSAKVPLTSPSTPSPETSISATSQSQPSFSGGTSTQIQTGGDSTLVTQVQAAIKNEPTLISIAPNIQVSAQQGTVTLSGNVSSEEQKQAIERVVKGTSGVVTVNNQVQVSSSSSLQPTGRSDQSSLIYSNAPSQAQNSTSAQSQTSISSDVASSTPEKSQSSVSSSENTLSPTSDRQSSREYGTNQVQSAQGDTSLGTSQPSQQSGLDASKSSQTESFSSTNKAASPDQSISTDTKLDLTPTSERPNDTNRIYGTNSSRFGFSDTNRAGFSGGENFRMNVRGTTDADKQLGAQIIESLRADTTLAASLPTLRINIDNGTATLRGNVKSEDEKNKIETAVKQVTGVTKVDNQLRVGASFNSGTTTEENK